MKKFVAPLQAIALLLLCSGMGWMVFVLASINPTPPTIMDLQARNTRDLSFVNMNSTAVALAKQMLAEMVPSPTGPYVLPVTGRETATPDLLAVITLKPVFTVLDPSTPTLYYIPPTATRERQNKPPLTPTRTPAPTRTLQPKVTPTLVSNSPTVPPTTAPTNSPEPEPTYTNAPQPTDPPTVEPPTLVPPSSTPGSIVVTTEPSATQATPEIIEENPAGGEPAGFLIKLYSKSNHCVIQPVCEDPGSNLLISFKKDFIITR